jgi:adenylate kinase family enzyme
MNFYNQVITKGINMINRNQILISFIIVLGLWAGYSQYRADRATEIGKLSAESAKLSERDSADSMLAILSDIRENTIENAKLQGRIEGMICVAKNIDPEMNTTSGVWHDGYGRGLEQAKFMEEMAYERGYHAATNDGNCPAGKDNLDTRASNSWNADKQKGSIEIVENKAAYWENAFREQYNAQQNKIDELNNTIFKLRAQLGEIDAKSKTATTATITTPMPMPTTPAAAPKK